ncbi:MAG: ATP-binding protein, partial [Proteobacteria bacterium]|nr:ATP-binding protein [Pseudomonadota bacterium]
MIYIKRHLSHKIQEAAQNFPALVLSGPRQTGKTTILRHLFPNHSYVTLDRPLAAEQAESDPEAFLLLHPAPLIIDEVQYAPALFRFLKIKIDEKRDLKGQYILTGSQKFTLMKGVSESLAGRAAIFDFEGLSCQELLAEKKICDDTEGLSELILRGGFPELWQDLSRPSDTYLDSYIATNLERDIKQVLAIGNMRDFERFLRACALRTSQQLNKSDLARDIGISVSTVAQWLSVLEALGQIYLLEPWFGNLNKRLVKSPKIFFAEPALMCILCGINAQQLLQS